MYNVLTYEIIFKKNDSLTEQGREIQIWNMHVEVCGRHLIQIPWINAMK